MAERRQLTVMFCDLVGSTTLSAELDPEDLRQVIGDYQAAVTEEVTKLGGFVAKYMGDGVLVYFGYPHAHEEDAEGALRAGLALVERIGRLESRGTRLSIRIGIATGIVVVGDLIGHGSAQERGVVGETPNLAARLQAMAKPGSVLSDDTTRRLVGELFECRDLGAVEIKGLPAPVRAWEVVGLSTIDNRFEALHSTRLTPLIGRDEEFGLLHAPLGTRQGRRRTSRACLRRSWYRQVPPHRCPAGQCRRRSAGNLALLLFAPPSRQHAVPLHCPGRTLGGLCAG